MTEEQQYDQFDAEFRATVDSFLYWRRLLRQGEGLDHDDEVKYRGTIKSSFAHTRQEALRIIAILKKENGIP